MLFKKLFKNEQYKNLEQKYRDLTDRVNALNRCFQRQNEELRRILENYVPGSITGCTITDTIAFGGLIENTFYLYKNGSEYVFNGLNLCSPKLIQGKRKISSMLKIVETGRNTFWIFTMEPLLKLKAVWREQLLMTEQEYNEQLKRVDKYYEYTKIIKNLEFKVRSFESGIGHIRSLNGVCETSPGDVSDGEGFSKLIKNKIVEAYKEQIDRIKKCMEEL